MHISERVRTMAFVQWFGIIPSKIHIAANRLKTLCNRPIPSHATEIAKPPRDKTKYCKACRQIEQQEKPFKDVPK
jgi:hypothetical protein